ncbi:MAG: hypothetical protein ACE5FG_14635 [Myxococcota bacterium]
MDLKSQMYDGGFDGGVLVCPLESAARRATPARFGGVGIIALMIVVFPANAYVALENVGTPSGEPGTGHAVANWIQLPFQALFVVWAWRYTRSDPGDVD